MSRTSVEFIANNVPDMHSLLLNVHEGIAAASRSRCSVYRSINTGLTVHSVYRNRHKVYRISFTRFRVSGHSYVSRLEDGIDGGGDTYYWRNVCVYMEMCKLRNMLLRIVLYQTILGRQ